MLNCIHYTSIHADLYREYADTSWMGKTQGVKDVRSSCVRYESVWTIFDDVQRVEDASNFTKTNPNEEVCCLLVVCLFVCFFSEQPFCCLGRGKLSKS